MIHGQKRIDGQKTRGLRVMGRRGRRGASTPAAASGQRGKPRICARRLCDGWRTAGTRAELTATPTSKEKNIAMAATLQEILLTPDVRPKVLTDCQALLDQEIAEKSGASGAAIKLAYKTATSFAPGYLRKTLEDVLPQIVGKLEPYWADFCSSGGSEFGDYLSKRGPEVSQDLLSLTDQIAATSKRPVIIKAYRAVRGSAAKHVEAALPRVGELVMRYAD